MGNEIQDVESRLKKRRTFIVLGAAGTAVGIVALSLAWNFYSFFKTASEVRQKQEAIEEKPVSRLQEKDWKSVMEVRINNLEDRLGKFEDKLTRIENLMEHVEGKMEAGHRNAPGIDKPLPPPEIKITAPSGKGEKISLPPPPKQPVLIKGPARGSGAGNMVQKKKPEVLREFRPEADKKGKSGKTKQEVKKRINLPTGFTKAILLSGLNAPTLQYGRDNPHPVLALLMDKTILANNKHLNLKGCMVLGSAYGELSSERAYIRLYKISCIDKDGRVYNQQVKGWIFGSDGIPGIRGRLVTRFGSVLAKTFIAGTLEGISRILQSTYTTVAISPIGTTTTVQPEDATKIAVASGFESAARRLADFYIKLANEYFPIIEIPPGKPVTVVFEGGEDIEERAKVHNPEPLNLPDRNTDVSERPEKGEAHDKPGR